MAKRRASTRDSKFSARLLISTVVVIAALGLQEELPKYYKLSHDGVEVEGKVVKKFPNAGNGVRYAFKPNTGNMYFGTGRAGFGNPEYEKLEVKSPVQVFYLADEPTVSCLGDPNQWFRHEALMAVLMGLIIPAVALLFRYLRLRQSA